MPLPASNTAWPPADLADLRPTLNTWDAWWIGDTAGLEHAYRNSDNQKIRPSQRDGGVVGAVARFFWGRPAGDLTQERRKLHVPIATDLCQASADLLWSEAPTITVEDTKTQTRLDELVDDGMLQAFVEGAEIGAALGGHFLRVTWDTSLAPRPFVTIVHADAAWPEFRWGKLVAVTFWHVVREVNQQVWRHLERHETLPDGTGIILHGLYQGTKENLGQQVPLADARATADLVVDELGSITTASPGLAVVYVPNQRPQRRWRKHPLGQNLGRSDLDGVEGLMDALDEVYTSWMRDIRLAKARLIVPQSMLDDNGPGRGASFDMDREVYSPVNAPPSSAANATGYVQAEQFGIRHEEHRSTAADLLDQILRTAGYSPETFGIDAGGGQRTATEVTAQQQRSFLTRDRKLRAVRPAVTDLLEKLLAVDAALFSSGVRVQRPDVEFPDGVQDSMLSLAQTAQALRAAEAASTKTLVTLLHPEWDDDQVDEEVALILDEQPDPILPDPTDPNVVLGADPRADLPEEPGQDPSERPAPTVG